MAIRHSYPTIKTALKRTLLCYLFALLIDLFGGFMRGVTQYQCLQSAFVTGFSIGFIMNIFAEVQEFLSPHRGPTRAVLPLDALFALMTAYHVGCGVTELAARWVPPGRTKPVSPTQWRLH